MSSKIPLKLRMFLEVAYGGQVKDMADALKVSKSTVYRWLDGKDISTTFLSDLLELGLDISWLVDRNDFDMSRMLADNDSGRRLREEHFDRLKK
ncbi:MAG: helix-turn-helix domain-containing protein ['Candidatus Kapabacteria' thiocyanatum]|nr:helix-turn-helix domain-containing protein ['Candidatus Kapabacteria' thiocyanatum]